MAQAASEFQLRLICQGYIISVIKQANHTKSQIHALCKCAHLGMTVKVGSIHSHTAVKRLLLSPWPCLSGRVPMATNFDVGPASLHKQSIPAASH